MKVVVLGALGSVGNYLLPLLAEDKRIGQIVAFSRTGTPKKPVDRVEYIKADALNRDDMKVHCEDADAVLCLVGLKYDVRVWQRDWPILIENCLSTIKPDAVFGMVDNLYMFGPELVDRKRPIKSDDPFTKTTGGKPAVRAWIDTQLLNSKAEGKCNTFIMRGSDFYGPGCKTSVVSEFMIKKMVQGAKAESFFTTEIPHTFTYVPDVAKAMHAAMFKPECWNRAYHVPNDRAVTLRQMVDVVADVIGPSAPREIKQYPYFAVYAIGRV